MTPQMWIDHLQSTHANSDPQQCGRFEPNATKANRVQAESISLSVAEVCSPEAVCGQDELG